MTIHEIATVVELVNETEIDTVWEYQNAMNHKTMFAAFICSEHCDIHISPAVLNPKLIYRNGKFIDDYIHLN